MYAGQMVLAQVLYKHWLVSLNHTHTHIIIFNFALGSKDPEG